MTISSKTVEVSKNVSASDAAEYLGCSYPHLIHLIKKNKLKAQKIRKQWFVDLNDLEKAKQTHLVTPRPKSGHVVTNQPKVVFSTEHSIKPEQNEDIEIRIKVSRSKYELINSVLVGGTEKTLKQTLELKIEEIFSSIQNQFKLIQL